MTEQQKIHPVDAEAPPPWAPPAAPPSLAPSEKSNSAHLQLPKKRRSCFRCLCWTLLAVIILIVAVAATAGILYLVLDPKVPNYYVDRLAVFDFTVGSDATVSATFNVTVTASNPNDKIAIYYGEGNELSAWYTDERLCAGSFRAFYQGHRNTTVLHVLLTGKTHVGGELLAELQRQQKTGMIPLAFRGDVPVRVKLGKLKLWKATFKVRCNLVVNNLSTSNDISIRSSSCKFKLKF